MPREEGDTFLRWSLSQRQVACSTSLTYSASFAGSARRSRHLGEQGGGLQPAQGSSGHKSVGSEWALGRVLKGKRWLPKYLAYPFFLRLEGLTACRWNPRHFRTGCATTRHPSTQYRPPNLEQLPLQKTEGMGMAGLWRTWPVGSDLREGLAKRSKLRARRVMELDRKHFPFSCAVSFPCDKVNHT